MRVVDQEQPEEFLGYRKTLVIAGPDYADVLEVESLDVMDLQPEIIEINGLSYERYKGDEDHEYAEVRFDYIVSRVLEVIKRPEMPPKPEVDADAIDNMTLEERGLTREEPHD